MSPHGNNNRGALHPECDLRYQKCAKNHQEPSQNKQEHHSPTKRNAVACPCNEPGLSAHWTQSGGQPAHLSLLPSTGVGGHLKTIRSTIPPPSAMRSRARAMSQDYPLTGPSPGANQHTYPSSLPPPETRSQTSLPELIHIFLVSTGVHISS